MKMKHTPGPWIYGPETGPDCTRIDAENGRVIAAVRSREITSWEQSRPIYSWSEEGAANARLIAAAPELLEAAHDAIECIEILGNLMDNIKAHGNYSQEATLLFLSHAASCLRNIPPAIAKATGA